MITELNDYNSCIIHSFGFTPGLENMISFKKVFVFYWQRGIRTKDGEFLSTETIRKEFTNDKMPSFTGKARLLVSKIKGVVETFLTLSTVNKWVLVRFCIFANIIYSSVSLLRVSE